MPPPQHFLQQDAVEMRSAIKYADTQLERLSGCHVVIQLNYHKEKVRHYDDTEEASVRRHGNTAKRERSPQCSHIHQ